MTNDNKQTMQALLKDLKDGKLLTNPSQGLVRKFEGLVTDSDNLVATLTTKTTPVKTTIETRVAVVNQNAEEALSEASDADTQHLTFSNGKLTGKYSESYMHHRVGYAANLRHDQGKFADAMNKQKLATALLENKVTKWRADLDAEIRNANTLPAHPTSEQLATRNKKVAEVMEKHITHYNKDITAIATALKADLQLTDSSEEYGDVCSSKLVATAKHHPELLSPTNYIPLKKSTSPHNLTDAEKKDPMYRHKDLSRAPAGMVGRDIRNTMIVRNFLDRTEQEINKSTPTNKVTPKSHPAYTQKANETLVTAHKYIAAVTKLEEELEIVRASLRDMTEKLQGSLVLDGDASVDEKQKAIQIESNRMQAAANCQLLNEYLGQQFKENDEYLHTFNRCIEGITAQETGLWLHHGKLIQAQAYANQAQYHAAIKAAVNAHTTPVTDVQEMTDLITGERLIAGLTTKANNLCDQVQKINGALQQVSAASNTATSAPKGTLDKMLQDSDSTRTTLSTVRTQECPDMQDILTDDVLNKTTDEYLKTALAEREKDRFVTQYITPKVEGMCNAMTPDNKAQLLALQQQAVQDNTDQDIDASKELENFISPAQQSSNNQNSGSSGKPGNKSGQSSNNQNSGSSGKPGNTSGKPGDKSGKPGDKSTKTGEKKEKDDSKTTKPKKGDKKGTLHVKIKDGVSAESHEEIKKKMTELKTARDLIKSKLGGDKKELQQATADVIQKVQTLLNDKNVTLEGVAVVTFDPKDAQKSHDAFKKLNKDTRRSIVVYARGGLEGGVNKFLGFAHALCTIGVFTYILPTSFIDFLDRHVLARTKHDTSALYTTAEIIEPGVEVDATVEEAQKEGEQKQTEQKPETELSATEAHAGQGTQGQQHAAITA